MTTTGRRFVFKVDGYTGGHIRFSLVEFSTDGRLGNGECCRSDDSATICRCNFYVHICLSVGFEIKKFYRDCWVGYHGSDMLAVNTLTESYNVSIPFTQWPTTRISIILVNIFGVVR
ncbi:unnamed protein product [Enterobius vermicularis]|uniref:MNNL domain-containing protein n=1 Tax=Enterobius vermicularis TaxID=51028 RepID=A0A0N4VIQ6_ENTVE|nr:unnamed protein product [Enterobius vermicularis]